MIYPLRFLIVGQSHYNNPLLLLVNPIIIHDNPYKSIRIHHNPSNSIVILLFPIVIQQLLKTSRRQWGMTRIFSASPVHVEHPHSMLPMMWKCPTHSLLNHGFWRGWKKLGGDSSSVAFSEDPPCHHFVRPPRPLLLAQRRRLFFAAQISARGAEATRDSLVTSQKLGWM